MALVDVFIIGEAKKLPNHYTVSFTNIAKSETDQYTQEQAFNRALSIFEKYGIVKSDEAANWIYGTTPNIADAIDACLEYLPGAAEEGTTDILSRESMMVRLARNESANGANPGKRIWDSPSFSISPPPQKRGNPSRTELFFGIVAASDGMTKRELHMLWLELAGKDYGEYVNKVKSDWETKKDRVVRQRRYSSWGRGNVQDLIDTWMEKGPDGKYRVRTDVTPETPFFRRNNYRQDFAKKGFGIDDENV
jgi:hypothetical protein